MFTANKDYQNDDSTRRSQTSAEGKYIQLYSPERQRTQQTNNT